MTSKEMILRVCFAVCVACTSAPLRANDAGATEISNGTLDENGFLVHTVRSAYQAGRTEIKALLPRELDRSKRHAVLYVLPVEAASGTRYGYGLLEVKRADLHNKFQLICVTPTFSHLPWYADHPDNPSIRQETYLLNTVMPFIERTYPVKAEPDGRLLVGFSKSGWGAFSLLLRHAETFGKAVAWDAPLMMDRPNKYGMGPIFGTQKNFDDYCLSKRLRIQAPLFRDHVRLIHFGYGNFRQHHEDAHALMAQLEIAFQYQDGPQRRHSWDSGWLPEAVGMLMETKRTE